jgi:hypothetical protein
VQNQFSSREMTTLFTNTTCDHTHNIRVQQEFRLKTSLIIKKNTKKLFTIAQYEIVTDRQQQLFCV